MEKAYKFRFYPTKTQIKIWYKCESGESRKNILDNIRLNSKC